VWAGLLGGWNTPGGGVHPLGRSEGVDQPLQDGSHTTTMVRRSRHIDGTGGGWGPEEAHG